jgi:hypothetical protein
MAYDGLFTSMTTSKHWSTRQPRAAIGHLYVVEFDSGWVKVGQTITWARRRKELAADFDVLYGWEIVRDWQSNLVSTLRLEDTPRSELCDLEIRLKDFARQTQDVSVFSDQLPNRGRRICGAGETETFRGCSFGDLVAYADVLARFSSPLRK